jgi:hypothetical protein
MRPCTYFLMIRNFFSVFIITFVILKNDCSYYLLTVTGCFVNLYNQHRIMYCHTIRISFSLVTFSQPFPTEKPFARLKIFAEKMFVQKYMKFIVNNEHNIFQVLKITRTQKLLPKIPSNPGIQVCETLN